MPRYSKIPAILRTSTRSNPDVIKPATPRLWNAKRRIKVSQGLTKPQYLAYKRNPESKNWRDQVSPDVAEFIDVNTSDSVADQAMRDHPLLPEEKDRVLRNPARFFSRPYNVPVQQRKQVFLYGTTYLYCIRCANPCPAQISLSPSYALPNNPHSMPASLYLFGSTSWI